jgi:hypothetical protein
LFSSYRFSLSVEKWFGKIRICTGDSNGLSGLAAAPVSAPCLQLRKARAESGHQFSGKREKPRAEGLVAGGFSLPMDIDCTVMRGYL